MATPKSTAPPLAADSRARLADLLGEASALFEILDNPEAGQENGLAEELRRISEIINETRSDIRTLGTGDLSEEKIPRAGQELDEVVKATEAATNTIMGAAEEILAADTSDAQAYQALVTDNVMAIFEACSFQDITGQRVNKVVNTLKIIEARIQAISDAFGLSYSADLTPDEREERERRLLLHGPSLTGEGVKQNAVDTLFDKCGVASQDSIDDIFGSFGEEGSEEVDQNAIDSLFD